MNSASWEARTSADFFFNMSKYYKTRVPPASSLNNPHQVTVGPPNMKALPTPLQYNHALSSVIPRLQYCTSLGIAAACSSCPSLAPPWLLEARLLFLEPHTRSTQDFQCGQCGCGLHKLCGCWIQINSYISGTSYQNGPAPGINGSQLWQKINSLLYSKNGKMCA